MTLYKPPILACCSNVPCFTANRERRRAAGQLAAQKNARYKDSYLRAFAEVKRYNGTKLRGIGASVLKVEASHSSAPARKASAELAQGLHRDVFLARGARVVLTRNLWYEVGLVNGIRGDVVDIVWAHGEKAPALPDFVVLRLEGYTGPVWSSDPSYEGCVPIAPFETSWSTTGDDRGHETRQQVPLTLCWAIIMHKRAKDRRWIRPSSTWEGPTLQRD